MNNFKIKHWKGSLTKENIELFRIDVMQLEPKECLLVFKVENKDIDVFNTPHYSEDRELIGKIEKVIQEHYTKCLIENIGKL
jgi:hypothetical protein